MTSKRKRSPSIEFVSWRRMASPPFDKELEGDDNFVLCTPQNAYFHVSAAILSLASPFFKNVIREIRRAKRPMRLDVEESQTPLEIILRLIYPVPDPVILDFDDFIDAYKAATKYQLDHAIQALRKTLKLKFVEQEPLRVYAVAVQHGLQEEKEMAAYQACKMPIQSWPSCEEYDNIPASRYHDLILYHKRRGAEAAKIIQAAEQPCCRHCSTQWLTSYQEAAVRALHEAPTTDRVFSFQFLTEHAPSTWLH
ncbi:hypothetical protein PHLGIDRAFT_20583 [Phlebiopsis gigantea 11061_1 CR5-6]|uniref:BTB domain-containing protein n=1 Tax=Phlebiopsis gigantea (strain 11061_1 CR5-6) TaxID=745531 RepID=A0A0C3RQ84_PHLG1|nr:hypothetical protein PHLGIDRAFT_20583 [Phlebiopsis gigantea 11061_1 CR5-6]